MVFLWVTHPQYANPCVRDLLDKAAIPIEPYTNFLIQRTDFFDNKGASHSNVHVLGVFT